MYEKKIIQEAADLVLPFAMYLDNELIGYAATYREADIQLDRLIFELQSIDFFRGVSYGV